MEGNVLWTVYGGLFLLPLGVSCLLTDLWHSRFQPLHKVVPLKATFHVFFLVVWGCLTCGFTAQVVLLSVLKSIGVSDAFPSSSLGIMVMQGTVIMALLYGFRSPHLFGNTSTHKACKPFSVMRQGLWFLLSAVPLLMVFHLGWVHLLETVHTALGMPMPKGQEIVERFRSEPFSADTILMVLAAGVMAPVSEELLFRKLVYGYLKGVMKPFWALILSSSAFALIHFNFVAFMPLLLLGILMARAYERTGCIGVPIMMHAVFNAHTLALIFLE